MQENNVSSLFFFIRLMTFPENTPAPDTPLADRMRPRSIEEFVGQQHLLGAGKLIYYMLKGKRLQSLIFWGPPGTGKTTLAHLIADASGCRLVSLSAVTSGIRDVREVIKGAAEHRHQRNKQTVLFIDEIHRFNKAQQDAFLPHVESGDIVLLGATTENPSFEVIAPLLSRTKVLVLKKLEDEHVAIILYHALDDCERGLGSSHLQLDRDAAEMIVKYAQGDARVALNTLELAALVAQEQTRSRITEDAVTQALQQKVLLYDKSGDEHYNIISALHKSLRSSDVQASLYWLARMIEAGEDPLYIARRLVRFASEDVGLADPRALEMTVAAKNAFHFIGLPEGKLALAQAVVYLAVAPKSNALYRAYSRAEHLIERTGSLPVPPAIRNAPTRLMKNLDYGKDYKYDHDYDYGISDQTCLPDEIESSIMYTPSDRGFEKTIRDRMAFIDKIKKQKERL